MSELEITLPDGSVRRVEVGNTPLDIARTIGPRLAKDAIGAELDGELVDLRAPLRQGGKFRLFTAHTPEAGTFI